MSEERGIGDNGGPPLQKFTAKHKLDRIREVLDMDITAQQKCVGVGIIVEADTDGIAAELSTKRLQTFASVSDRETVYRATKVLKEEKVTEPIKVKGKPNSYRVLPAKVIESIVDAYNQSKVEVAELAWGSRVEPDMGGPVKPDGLGAPHPVGSSPTSPVRSNPTGGPNHVGSDPTSRVGQDQPSRAYKESPSEIDNTKQKQTTTTSVEQEAARGSGGFNFDILNGTAVDLTAFIAKHNNVDETTAKNMLRTNVQTFSPEAMMEAFSVTLAEMSGGLIARPYKYLIETARRIKDSRAKKAPTAAVSTEAAGDKIRRFAEEAEERQRQKKGVRP